MPCDELEGVDWALPPSDLSTNSPNVSYLRTNIVSQPLMEIKDIAGQDLIVISHRSDAACDEGSGDREDRQPRNAHRWFAGISGE
jgi:hypothetical protein